MNNFLIISLFLAVPTIKCASACLDDTLYRLLTAWAGQALTRVNCQPLIKFTLLARSITVIAHGRTSMNNCFLKDFHNIIMDGFGLRQSNLTSFLLWIHAASKKDLAGID